MLRDLTYAKVSFGLILGLAVSHIVFATWPTLDLWVAGLFYRDSRFPLADLMWLEVLRNSFWNLAIGLALGCLMMWIATLLMGFRAHTPVQVWFFGWFSFVLGPGILVNGVLKSHWGRARPAHLEQFGGDKLFTPPFEIADQCVRNCSFVSGEGAASVMFALVVGILLWNNISRRYLPLFITVLTGIAVVFALLRVFKGRHFLSDILIGGWMMALIALGLFWAFRLHAHLPNFTLRNIRSDFRYLRAHVWRPAARRIAKVFYEV